jgi:PAS domain S-box-containing protein
MRYQKPNEKEDKPIKELLNFNEYVFRQLIKNSFDIFVLIDKEGIQQFVSDSCREILGFSPDELTGIPVIEEFIHPDDRAATREGLRSIIENKTNGGTQYRHRHKDGGWVYLEAYGTNQLTDPKINAVVLNIRDISERKKAEKLIYDNERHLKELNATKDRFFSIISHDLKSPFNSIIGFSDLLLTQIKSKDYEGIENYARIIQKSALRAMDLLTNLLEWSRSQTGKLEYNPEYLELVQTISSAIDFFKDYGKQKSISIAIKAPHHIPVMADPHMLNTVLRNLISNAIKFTHPGGKITIEIKPWHGYVVVCISDTGVGISRENIDKLFRIEYSHSTEGTAKENGTGLGLLLCKEFVEMHGGKIWVDSIPEQGSTFSFTLPTAIDY